MINQRRIKAIDLVLVVGTLALLSLLIYFAYQPARNVSFAPPEPLFTFNSAGLILISDNLNFETYTKVFAEDGVVVEFEPGAYYWRIQGGSDEVTKLTFLDGARLVLRDMGDGTFGVFSAGNNLNVKVSYRGESRERVVLQGSGEKGTKVIHVGGPDE